MTEEIKKIENNSRELFSKQEVEKALDEMAEAINEKLSGTNPIILCTVIGGIIPTGLLLPRLNFPLQLDYIHATRYAGETTGGELAWETEPQISFQDRDIIVFDDILDEGVTLAGIVDYCRQQGVRNVYTAVLVEKRHNRKQGIRADYVGLEIVDRYVFGYGMDYHGYLRNVPGIYAVKGL